LILQDASGDVFIGKVWPGFTAYPDFLNPKTIQYWQNEVRLALSLDSVTVGGKHTVHYHQEEWTGTWEGEGSMGGGGGERERERERESDVE
jgi:hypothetical protein